MSTAADLLLVATDPQTGAPRLGRMKTDAVLGGAMLTDLVAAERLRLQGEGRQARVVVADPAPVDEPAIETAFARLRGTRPLSAQGAVNRLGRGAQTSLYAQLAEEDIVRRHEETVLRVVRRPRYHILQTARHNALTSGIRAALMHNIEPDEQIRPLIGLLWAGDLTSLIVERPERKQAARRAKEIAEDEWTNDSVRKAVLASRAAVVATVVAGGAAVAVGAT